MYKNKQGASMYTCVIIDKQSDGSDEESLHDGIKLQ